MRSVLLGLGLSLAFALPAMAGAVTGQGDHKGLAKKNAEKFGVGACIRGGRRVTPWECEGATGTWTCKTELACENEAPMMFTEEGSGATDEVAKNVAESAARMRCSKATRLYEVAWECEPVGARVACHAEWRCPRG